MAPLDQLMEPDRRTRSRWLASAILLLTVIYLTSLLPTLALRRADDNLYFHQAKAFLRGESFVEIDPRFGDVAHYEGRDYVVFPPFPALLLTPLVWVLDDGFGSTAWVGLVLTGFAAVSLFKLLRRLDVELSTSRWMLLAFFMGTAYWPCLQRSHAVWYFAQLVAVTCILLAIGETFGRGRPMLVGLLIGMAMLSRQLTVYSVVFLGMAFWDRASALSIGRRIARLFVFLFPVLLSVAGYLGFNWIRFDDPLETGYRYLDLPDTMAARVEQHGLFSLHYVIVNFIQMFVQGFHVEFVPPDFLKIKGLDAFGTSITFASPFVFVALAARWRGPLTTAAWISIILTLAHQMFYYSNGWAQVHGPRYALDFMPILIILVSLGTRRVSPVLWKGAIIYSVALCGAAHLVFESLRLF